MADLFFALLAAVTVFAAIGVIASREAVHSALCLTLHLLGVGALYLGLHHQFLAVAQMLVYAGAVMVVFMFAVTTLSPAEEPLKLLGQNGLPIVGIGIGLMTFGGLFWSFSISSLQARMPSGTNPEGLVPVKDFAYDLFGPFLLPFEGTAFLLLTALVGAIILGGRRQVGDG